MHHCVHAQDAYLRPEVLYDWLAASFGWRASKAALEEVEELVFADAGAVVLHLELLEKLQEVPAHLFHLALLHQLQVAVFVKLGHCAVGDQLFEALHSDWIEAVEAWVKVRGAWTVLRVAHVPIQVLHFSFQEVVRQLLGSDGELREASIAHQIDLTSDVHQRDHSNVACHYEQDDECNTAKTAIDPAPLAIWIAIQHQP